MPGTAKSEHRKTRLSMIGSAVMTWLMLHVPAMMQSTPSLITPEPTAAASMSNRPPTTGCADGQPRQARRFGRHAAGDLVPPDRPRQRRQHLRDAIDLQQLPGVGLLCRVEQAAAADDRVFGGVLARQAELEVVLAEHHLADPVVRLRLVALQPGEQHRRLGGPHAWRM